MFGIRGIGVVCIVLFAYQTAWSQSLPNLSSTKPVSNTGKKEADRELETANCRSAELKRRASDPGTPSSNSGTASHRAGYSEILRGTQPLSIEEVERIKITEAMPPTHCKSIGAVPKDPNGSYEGPWRAHESTLHDFENTSGFGQWRMLIVKNARGKMMGAPGIDRVELVSLLTNDEPSIYVLDGPATPPAARLARRRPLDEFEVLGLDAVRRGNNLVWTKEAPNRMFGAVRAARVCLECHSGAKENDLLGAFSYHLETSIDKLVKFPNRAVSR